MSSMNADNSTWQQHGCKYSDLAEEDLCRGRWTATLIKYSFATEGVGLSTVAVIGTLANSVSIAVLTQRTMKTQISALLITLAVFDMLFLFCTFPVFTVQSVNYFLTYLNTCVYPDGKDNEPLERNGNYEGTRQAFLNSLERVAEQFSQ